MSQPVQATIFGTRLAPPPSVSSSHRPSINPMPSVIWHQRHCAFILLQFYYYDGFYYFYYFHYYCYYYYYSYFEVPCTTTITNTTLLLTITTTYQFYYRTTTPVLTMGQGSLDHHLVQTCHIPYSPALC